MKQLQLKREIDCAKLQKALDVAVQESKKKEAESTVAIKDLTTQHEKEIKREEKPIKF